MNYNGHFLRGVLIGPSDPRLSAVNLDMR